VRPAVAAARRQRDVLPESCVHPAMRRQFYCQ
jgi:hypothetical protein